MPPSCTSELGTGTAKPSGTGTWAAAGWESGEALPPADRPRSCNPTRLICRSEVRAFLLAAAERSRPYNGFTRVSEQTLLEANAALRQWLLARVHRSPSRGRTL